SCGETTALMIMSALRVTNNTQAIRATMSEPSEPSAWLHPSTPSSMTARPNAMLDRANHILPVTQMNTPLAVNSTPMMTMAIALRRSLRLYFCTKFLNAVFIEVVYSSSRSVYFQHISMV